MEIKIILLILGCLGVVIFLLQIVDLFRNRNNLERYSWWKTIGIGLPTGFLDVFGIGSFAPSTLILRSTKQVDDKYLPGVLNVGFAIPGIIEALIFIDNINLDVRTFIVLTIAGVMGALLCSTVASKLSRNKVRYTLCIALLLSTVFIIINQLHIINISGESNSLEGIRLLIGIIGMFMIGAGMTIGVGMFAPGMALLYLLGMSPIYVLPILMGCCAFVMFISGVNFIKNKAYEIKNTFGLTIGYSVGVILASLIVISINTNLLKWIIIIPIIYTSINLYYSARKANY